MREVAPDVATRRGPAAPTGWHRRVTIPLVLAAVTILLYLPTFGYDFVNYDDRVFVTGNRFVSNGWTAEGVRWAFAIHGPSQYHPLAWLSHMLDVELFGLAAGAHHAVNVLIHVATTLLLYRLLLVTTNATWRSAAVAALFGWHPTRVESVAWIAERKDLLCGLFVVLTLLVYASYARKPRAGRYALVLFTYALALASKPMAVVVPVLLLLIDRWPLDRLAGGRTGHAALSPPRSGRMILLEKLPLFAMASASAVLSYLAQLDAQAVVPLDAAPLGARVANAIVSTTRYLRMTVWPTNLAVFYPRQAWPTWQVLTCAALLAAITAAVAWSRRPYAIVGWAWFLVALSPVIGILQVGDQAMADRYTYLPLIGLFVLVAWAAEELAERSPAARRAAPLVSAAALAGFAGATAVQVTHWRSDEALFARAAAVTRNNYLAHQFLAVALAEQGRMDEAVAHYARAADAGPRYVAPRLNLGILAEQQGDFVQSERWLLRALSIQPRHREARFALANLRLRQGRAREAATLFEQLAREDAHDADARVNLGAALEVIGDRAGAEAAYREALRINPNDADAKANLESLTAPAAPAEDRRQPGQ